MGEVYLKLVEGEECLAVVEGAVGECELGGVVDVGNV